MYCRKCGNKIGDTDHFCENCGTPTGFKQPPSGLGEPEEPKEEIVFNPPYDNKSPFTETEPSDPEQEEDLKEFISDKEFDIQKETQEDKADSGVETEKNSEFNWNVHEFPEKRKTDDVEFNWNIEDFGPKEKSDFGSQEAAAAAAAFEEELFREIRDESSRIREQNIDRFFTFSRKNEEFQKLLDREYEKFKMRSEPEGVSLQSVEAEAEVPEEARHEEPPLDTEIPFDEPSSDTESLLDEPASDTEIPFDEPVPDTEIPFDESSPDTEIPPGEAEKPAESGKAEHISEMALARAQFFGEELVRDNESIKRKLSSEEPETENEQEEPEIKNEQVETETENEQEEAEAENNQVETEVENDREEKPKRSAGQIILVIIAVILAIEIIILGIRYFAPESQTARMIGDTQTRIIQIVSGWADGISDMFSGNPSNNDDDNEDSNSVEGDDADQNGPDAEQPMDDGGSPPAPDPNPTADKNALVSSQLGNNTNIEQVRANESLAFQPGKDYGQGGINNSKPITNNIWLTPENGDPVYYDKAVVGTVIAFDSRWIDYVNGGDKSVLDLLKKDSEAYRKAASFSKVGKVKETFKLLEIGEIRQSGNGFYVWAHEELEIVENGKTTNQKYNWIYHLEPVDGKMQIVNYFKFQ